jgi:hypothetical protein
MKDNLLKIPQEWLKKSMEKTYGKSDKWDHETWEEFYSNFGLLVDFVTDCWPNGADQTPPTK